MYLKQGEDELDFPEKNLHEWQTIIDLVARMAGVPVGLIMRVCDDDIEVFVASKGGNNPYHVGEREHLCSSGLYCEEVISQQEKLLVANALKSDRWCSNPDIRLNMISYLGFPIRLASGKPFGTICLLDDRENAYSPDLITLMEKMRDLIEGQLRLLEENRLQRLFANESLLRKVLDNIPTAVACCTLDLNAKPLYLNEHFVRTFGYTMADIPTMDAWCAVAYPDVTYRAARYQSWQASLELFRQTPDRQDTKSFRIRCKDGRDLDVLLGAIVIEGMTLLTLTDITELTLAESELRQARIAAEGARIRHAAEQLERTRLSRELHDGVGQTMQAIRLQMQLLGRKHKIAGLATIIDELDEASNELREISHTFHPAHLRDIPLATALQQRCDRLATRGVPIRYDLSDEIPPLPHHINDNLFRIAQELLANAIRHANALQIWMSLDKSQDLVRLSVSDDGSGISDHETARKGNGLQNVRERCELMGAVCHITSDSRGTRITVEVPVT